MTVDVAFSTTLGRKNYDNLHLKLGGVKVSSNEHSCCLPVRTTGTRPGCWVQGSADEGSHKTFVSGGVEFFLIFFLPCLPPSPTLLCKGEATEWKSAGMQTTHRLTPDGRHSAVHSNKRWQKTSDALILRGNVLGLPARGSQV